MVIAPELKTVQFTVKNIAENYELLDCKVSKSWHILIIMHILHIYAYI